MMIGVATNNRIYRFLHRFGRHVRCISHSRDVGDDLIFRWDGIFYVDGSISLLLRPKKLVWTFSWTSYLEGLAKLSGLAHCASRCSVQAAARMLHHPHPAALKQHHSHSTSSTKAATFTSQHALRCIHKQNSRHSNHAAAFTPSCIPATIFILSHSWPCSIQAAALPAPRQQRSNHNAAFTPALALRHRLMQLHSCSSMHTAAFAPRSANQVGNEPQNSPFALLSSGIFKGSKKNANSSLHWFERRYKQTTKLLKLVGQWQSSGFCPSSSPAGHLTVIPKGCSRMQLTIFTAK